MNIIKRVVEDAIVTRARRLAEALIIFPIPITLTCWLFSRFTFVHFTPEGIAAGVIAAALAYTLLPRKEAP